MAMFGKAIRQVSGIALAAVAFIGASNAADALTYQVKDLDANVAFGEFDTDDTGAITNMSFSVGGETFDTLAAGSDDLAFNASTGALDATGGGYTALTNGSGSFLRIINTMVNGKLMLEWDLLTGASYDTADLVSYGHYQVNPVGSGSTVSSVPVPASIIMLGTVMVGAGAFAARRRNRKA